ncbi:MAG: hypothetical protein IKD43_00340 [Clostridia bacterium]|nr:hypothetical protein [Clostridia bacterium]
MKELMLLKVPTAGEIMTTVRLATGGLGSLTGLGLEESEDCKVCVTESLLLLRHAGYLAASINFCEDDGLFVCIMGEGEIVNPAPMPEDEISAALLEALAADVKTEKREGALYRVSFRFAR